MRTIAPADPLPAEAADGPIIFFDGVCGLCNRSVDFILKRDTAGRFRFAPLQGAFAARALTGLDQAQAPDSMLLLQDGVLHARSTGVLRAAAQLPTAARWLRVLLWIPRPLRDLVYRVIARNRYRVFGKEDACRLPTPQERARFLM